METLFRRATSLPSYLEHPLNTLLREPRNLIKQQSCAQQSARNPRRQQLPSRGFRAWVREPCNIGARAWIVERVRWGGEVGARGWGGEENRAREYCRAAGDDACAAKYENRRFSKDAFCVVELPSGGGKQIGIGVKSLEDCSLWWSGPRGKVWGSSGGCITVWARSESYFY